MKTLILTIGGVFSGYILGNIEYKRFDEIIDEISTKGKVRIDIISEFIGQTFKDIEGFDSDIIKLNVGVFIDKLSSKTDEYLKLKNFNEKITFVEETITEITADLIKKSTKIEKRK